MPNEELVASFRRAKADYEGLCSALVPILIRMALDSVAEALPGTFELELLGEVNEDWLPTLRIQEVRSESGKVLFDGETEDPGVADAIDKANIDYLELLVNVAGEYMGLTTIDRTMVQS